MSQHSLFKETLDVLPDIQGLAYISDFISEAEEAALVQQIDSQSWMTDLKRRVQHYGYRYDYKARSINPGLYIGPLPEWIRAISQKLVSNDIFQTLPDQLIINEYLPGQGIAAHTDCIPCFGNTIVSLSLLSPVILTLAKDHQQEEIALQPRSLLILKEAARYEWKHGIAPRQSDVINGMRTPRSRRLSLTFRTIVK